MAQNVPPAADDRDDIYAVMQKLSEDSRVVKSAHFIAAQQKKRNATILGVAVVVLNVLIGSGLIETLGAENTAKTMIKALSFLAAAIAGVQTFFNYQKQVECHTNAGDVYSSINRRLGLLMAEYQEQPANRAALINEFKALNAEYLKANVDSKPCVPTDGNYNSARAGVGDRGGKAAL